MNRRKAIFQDPAEAEARNPPEKFLTRRGIECESVTPAVSAAWRQSLSSGEGKKARIGAEIRYTSFRQSVVAVETPRAYSLVCNAAIGQHLLHWAAHKPGPQRFAFAICAAEARP